MISLSIILATTFRPTLSRAILSATSQMTADDELLIVGEGVDSIDTSLNLNIRLVYCRKGNDWGMLERNVAMQYALGTHLMFIDDDDRYLPGALEAVRNSLTVYPNRPHMFRMINDAGLPLWQRKEIVQGNHGTPCFVTPNDYKRLGEWERGLYEGDFKFCQSTLEKYPEGALVWSEAVIYGCKDWVMAPMEIG